VLDWEQVEPGRRYRAFTGVAFIEVTRVLKGEHKDRWRATEGTVADTLEIAQRFAEGVAEGAAKLVASHFRDARKRRKAAVLNE
jgi:hypothetical protein